MQCDFLLALDVSFLHVPLFSSLSLFTSVIEES